MAGGRVLSDFETQLADYTIQNGAQLSRARVVTFRHNDIADLEQVLQTEIENHNRLKCVCIRPLNIQIQT